MSYGEDVYSKPEKHGLVIFAELDEPDMSYEYNMFVVWHDPKTGEIFYATDSGCSCPSPFEQLEGRESLTRVTKESLADFEAALNSWASNPDYYHKEKGTHFIPADKRAALVDLVRFALRKVPA